MQDPLILKIHLVRSCKNLLGLTKITRKNRLLKNMNDCFVQKECSVITQNDPVYRSSASNFQKIPTLNYDILQSFQSLCSKKVFDTTKATSFFPKISKLTVQVLIKNFSVKSKNKKVPFNSNLKLEAPADRSSAIGPKKYPEIRYVQLRVLSHFF